MAATQTGAPGADTDAAAAYEQLALEYDAKFEQATALSAAEKGTAESKILTAFGKVSGAVVVEPPDCRATLCRLVVKSPSQDELEGVLHEVKGVPYGNRAGGKIHLHAGLTVPRRSVAADGSVTATIYINGHLEEP